MFLAPHIGFTQVSKTMPVAVSHRGVDEVGRSVAHRLEEAIRTSKRFSLIAQNTPRPRIIITLDSVVVPQLQGQVSAIGISFIYYRRGLPGVGVFLGTAVNSCSLKIIESCAQSIIPKLEEAADFLKRHDPDLWNTL